MSEACSDHSGAPMPVKWKKGDVHPVTGMVFWSYSVRCKNRERWIAPDKIEEYVRVDVEAKKHHRQQKKAEFDKWIADKSNRKWKQGDVHPETGLVFVRYCVTGKNFESWMTRARFEEYRSRIRKSQKKSCERIAGSRAKYKKEWARKNRDSVNNTIRKRKNSDPLFAAVCRFRTSTLYAFKRRKMMKPCNTTEILGCNWDVLKKFMESHFQPGMTWENMGKKGWHIDHHIPLASAKTEEEVAKLCHYTNLRPLWAKDNMAKKAKHPDEFYGTK